jgi:hypothetical protein
MGPARGHYLSATEPLESSGNMKNLRVVYAARAAEISRERGVIVACQPRAAAGRAGGRAA